MHVKNCKLSYIFKEKDFFCQKWTKKFCMYYSDQGVANNVIYFIFGVIKVTNSKR